MSEWISVKDELPENCKNVLARQSYSEIYNPLIIACYALKNSLEAGEESYDWAEYSEEKGEYMCPEGWYEQQINWDDYASISVPHGSITHWMPLPEPPNND